MVVDLLTLSTFQLDHIILRHRFSVNFEIKAIIDKSLGKVNEASLLCNGPAKTKVYY